MYSVYSAYSDPLRFSPFSPFRAGIHEYGEYTGRDERRSRHGSRMMVDAVRGRSRRRRTGTVPVSDAAAGPGRAADLYSVALVNTRRRHPRSGSRTPKTVGTGRDTPRLYALYSVVFRCHLHTNSASQPYCRKGFQICIQCIQRIPTPLVFRLSLLLGREYMNTVNTSGRSERRHGMIRRRWSMATAVRHSDDAPEPSPRWMRPRYPDKMAGLYSAAPVNTRRSQSGTGHERRKTSRTGRDTPCLYALYSVVFRRRMHTNSARKPYCRKGFQICIQCIQRIPTPFVFAFSLLLGREYMNTVNTPPPGPSREAVVCRPGLMQCIQLMPGPPFCIQRGP